MSALTVTLTCGAITTASAQAVTVVEYYNKALDAYFVTGRTAEQQQLDAVADFQRTGMTFQAVAASGAPAFMTRICRFYISTASPFSSTHFYGREGTDCEQIRARNLTGFTYEDYDFALEQPVGGACPVTTTTIYRSFRPASAGKTANHRYSASSASYVATASAGYTGEQAAFCASAATDVTPLLQADCGTFYYPSVRVSYQSLSGAGVPNSWVQFSGTTKTPFNGRQATPVVTRFPSGENSLILIENAVDTWSDLGTNTDDAQGSHDAYYNGPTVFPRQMAFGQRINISREVVFNPGQTTGNASQSGHVTLVSSENVSVDAGTYKACKFSSELTTVYPAIGRTDVRRATTWVAPNVGVVKASILDTTATTATPTAVETKTEVSAVAVQPL